MSGGFVDPQLLKALTRIHQLEVDLGVLEQKVIRLEAHIRARLKEEADARTSEWEPGVSPLD